MNKKILLAIIIALIFHINHARAALPYNVIGTESVNCPKVSYCDPITCGYSAHPCNIASGKLLVIGNLLWPGDYSNSPLNFSVSKDGANDIKNCKIRIPNPYGLGSGMIQDIPSSSIQDLGQAGWSVSISPSSIGVQNSPIVQSILDANKDNLVKSDPNSNAYCPIQISDEQYNQINGNKTCNITSVDLICTANNNQNSVSPQTNTAPQSNHNNLATNPIGQATGSSCTQNSEYYALYYLTGHRPPGMGQPGEQNYPWYGSYGSFTSDLSNAGYYIDEHTGVNPPGYNGPNGQLFGSQVWSALAAATSNGDPAIFHINGLISGNHWIVALSVNTQAGTITYYNPNGGKIETQSYINNYYFSSGKPTNANASTDVFFPIHHK